MDSWIEESTSGDLAPLSLSWIANSADMGYESGETDPTLIEVPAHVELRHRHMPHDGDVVNGSVDEGLLAGQRMNLDNLDSMASNESPEPEEEFEDMDSDPAFGRSENPEL